MKLLLAAFIGQGDGIADVQFVHILSLCDQREQRPDRLGAECDRPLVAYDLQIAAPKDEIHTVFLLEDLQVPVIAAAESDPLGGGIQCDKLFCQSFRPRLSAEGEESDFWII